MLRAGLVTLVILIAGPVHGADTGTLWRNLAWFDGHWTGTLSGIPGQGSGERCFDHIMDRRYLLSRSRLRFPPQPRNPEGERQAQWQIFSRDHDRGLITLRRFGYGGQVITFELDQEASRSDRYVFESVHFENAPEDMHARLTIGIVGTDSFRERLELGAEPTELVLVTDGRWRRESGSRPCADWEPNARP